MDSANAKTEKTEPTLAVADFIALMRRGGDGLKTANEVIQKPGFNPNQSSKGGVTPLHAAYVLSEGVTTISPRLSLIGYLSLVFRCEFGHADICKLLLDRGASINAVTFSVSLFAFRPGHFIRP
jgi:hypothetical protein